MTIKQKADIAMLNNAIELIKAGGNIKFLMVEKAKASKRKAKK